MFVFSTKQFNSLLQIKEDFKADHLLDLGAGDGRVTEMMAGHFMKVSATEVSYMMQRRLRQRGYTYGNLFYLRPKQKPTCLASCHFEKRKEEGL